MNDPESGAVVLLLVMIISLAFMVGSDIDKLAKRIDKLEKKSNVKEGDK